MNIVQFFDHMLFYLSELAKKIGNNIVFMKFNVPALEINLDQTFLSNLDIFLELYLSYFSKNPEQESKIIEDFKNYSLEDLNDEKSLEDYLGYVNSIIAFISNLISQLKSEQAKNFKTMEFYLISLDNERLKDFVIKGIVDYLESFIKIRGNYVGDEFKNNVLNLITYLKNFDFSKDLSLYDELLFDIQRRIQDYEYYLICKDRVFTVVPSSYIWFEFLLHCYYLYEGNIELSSLEELYEKRLKPSFIVARAWYERLYNSVICRNSEKKEIYELIVNNIDSIESYLDNVFNDVKKNYPQKVDINEEFFSKNLYLVFEKTEELQNKSMKFDDKKAKLKNTGIFENFYDIVVNVYSNNDSLLVLYSFYESISSVLSYLEDYEPDYLTPFDRNILNNKEQFEFMLEKIRNYIISLDGDVLIDLIEHFENNIEPVLINLREDYNKIENILEPQKVVCFNCGTENDPYLDNCIKCGKKLFKPQLESKGVIKTIISKISKISDISELDNYLIILMNILNNSYSGINEIHKSLDNIQAPEVEDLKLKIDNILNHLSFIREKVSFLMNNQISLDDVYNFVSEVDPVVDDLDNQLSILYSNVKQLATFTQES